MFFTLPVILLCLIRYKPSKKSNIVRYEVLRPFDFNFNFK